MSRFWVRRPPTSRESLATGLVALATAAVTGTVAWYITRTFMSRDSISLRPEEGDKVRHRRPKTLSRGDGSKTAALANDGRAEDAQG